MMLLSILFHRLMPLLVRRFLLEIVGVVCAVILASAACSAAAGQSSLVIEHVNVVNVKDGSLLQDMAVVIVGDRIAEVTPTAKVTLPKGIRVVDGRGKFLIPGLWDMHVHTIFGDWLPKDEKVT